MDYKPEVDEIETLKPGSKVGNDIFSNTSSNTGGLELPESLKSLTPEELETLHKKTKRKLDMRILPTLVVMFLLNFLDRNNIATARLGGLEEDLKLKGTQYQTSVSILFVGYILMQIPFNILLNRWGRPSLFMAGIMTIWGVISTCSGAVHSYGGLLTVRIMLGFIEAGFFCSSLYYLSCWYTRKELAFRNSIFYSGGLLSGAFAGLIGAGIINGMDGVRGLRAWRWLFIIEGSITVALVPFAHYILPDNPSNTKWLSQQEKDVVMWKLKCEVGQDDSDEIEAVNSYKQGLKLAVSDPKVWMVTGMCAFLVAATGVANFFPSVVQTLKFNRITTLCLTAPPYLLAVVTTFIWAWHADKTGERFWHVVIPLLVSLASFIIAAATLNIGARYFAMCIMVPSLYCAFTLILSWMSNCVPRPPIKRAVALAIMNCLSNSASIWSAYLYNAKEAPRYTLAFSCNAGFILASIVMACILRFYLKRLNKQIEMGTMNWEKELGKGNDGSNINEDFRYLI